MKKKNKNRVVLGIGYYECFGTPYSGEVKHQISLEGKRFVDNPVDFDHSTWLRGARVRLVAEKLPKLRKKKAK